MTTENLIKKIEECGYQHVNFHDGLKGNSFRIGLKDFLERNKDPQYPIKASANVWATEVDKPTTWATFNIVNDKEGLTINSIQLTMFECHGSGIRMELDLDIKKIDDIPSRDQAAKFIYDKWTKTVQENRKGWSKRRIVRSPKKGL